MHVADLLPTVGKLAGIKFDPHNKLDGIDQWGVIKYGGTAARNEIVNFDNIQGFGSYIYNKYKLVNGTISNGIYDGWLASKSNDGNNDSISYAINVLNSTASRSIYSIQKKNRLTIDKILDLRASATIRCSNALKKNPCDPRKAPCIFEIFEDPCEENNLASSRSATLKRMLSRFNDKVKTAVPSGRKPADPACDPINFDLNWQWWQEDS